MPGPDIFAFGIKSRFNGPAGASASQYESQTSSKPVKTNGADRTTVNSSGAVRVTSVTVFPNSISIPASQFSTGRNGGGEFLVATGGPPWPVTGGSKDMSWQNNRH